MAMRKQHVAVVGAGPWGRNLARNFHALGALRVVCDVDKGNREAALSRYDGIEVTASFQAVLDNPAIDAVVIATPATLHASMAQEALLAGKDVFVEKPMALSTAEGEELVRLAEQRERVLMVGHLLWYHPAILKLKRLIDQGELGQLRYLYSQRANLGRVRKEENILWSFAPHDISVILGLVGGMPERVQAQGGYYLQKKVADVTATTLTFTQGARAHVFVSWLHPYKEHRLVVVGDRKMAVFNDLEPEDKLLLYPHTIEWKGDLPVTNLREAERVPVELVEPLQRECEHFLNCLDTRTKPRTDGREGLRVLRVLRQCQEAMEGERRVKPAAAAVPTKSEAVLRFPGVQLHPTAEVEEGTTIGPGTRIWHWSHIMEGAQLGADCRVGQNVFIGRHVVIGEGVKIQNNVSVYEGVTLEDHVFCGPSMVFTNVRTPRSEIERKHQFEPTLVRQGATLGANCTIICGHTIGRYAMIGAGAVVTRDVPDHALVLGVPAKVAGWVCRCGKILSRVPDLGEDVRALQCSTCGGEFIWQGTSMEALRVS